MTNKQFDPSWPFPQFDEDGVQLLPPEFDQKPRYYAGAEHGWSWDGIADYDEALL